MPVPARCLHPKRVGADADAASSSDATVVASAVERTFPDVDRLHGGDAFSLAQRPAFDLVEMAEVEDCHPIRFLRRSSSDGQTHQIVPALLSAHGRAGNADRRRHGCGRHSRIAFVTCPSARRRSYGKDIQIMISAGLGYRKWVRIKIKMTVKVDHFTPADFTNFASSDRPRLTTSRYGV